jgi:integrase
MRLFRAPICEDWRGLRTLALFVGLVLTGLRVSEWIGIRRSDVEHRQLESGQAGWTFRVKVKGGAERVREWPVAARLAIEAWRAAAGLPFDQLPANARLWPWSRDLALYLCRTYGEQAGIARLCPHRLRHTCARLRREAGQTVQEIQDTLGHASELHTLRYLQRIVPVADPGAAELAKRLGLKL